MTSPHQPADTSRRKPRSRWQIGLRGLFVLVGVLAVVIGLYANRWRKFHQAAAVLKQLDVYYGVAENPWYDRVPGIEPPPIIESVTIWPNNDVAVVGPLLADLGTVRRVSFLELSVPELELVSQIDSIETIEACDGITADEVRPLLKLPLKDFSVSGADVNIPADALELLYTVPTLEKVGTAHGEPAVPQALRDKRPDVSIYITDFPP